MRINRTEHITFRPFPSVCLPTCKSSCLSSTGMSDCSAVEEVLSLQEHCLLYLITHVEDYSPQTLALLPRHLRRALLSSVAPLHLYQLDQTEVASGIDAEAIWRDVNKTMDTFALSLLTDPSTSRQRFINAVFAQVTCRTSNSPSAFFANTVGDLVKMPLELTLFGLLEKRLSTGIAKTFNTEKLLYTSKKMSLITFSSTWTLRFPRKC